MGRPYNFDISQMRSLSSKSNQKPVAHSGLKEFAPQRQQIHLQPPAGATEK
jgi:hypothetical protein